MNVSSAGVRTRRPEKPLRVLMVTPLYLPGIGGVERHVHEVATRVAAADNVSVTVLTTDRDGFLADRERDGDLEVLRVPAYPRGRDWLFAPGIASTIAGENWDVIHVQSYHTLVAPLAMAAAARRRVPYLLTFHGGGHSTSWRNGVRVAQRAALRPLFARAAALVAVARFEIDEYARELHIPPGRFVLIPNGVDLPPAPSRPEGLADTLATADRGDPLIASVGRLERYKGHHRVIAAFAHLHAQRPSARLWIAGAGPYERNLRELTEQLGLTGAVEIAAVDARARGEMVRRLSAVDLVVLLSDFETHPIAALEAVSLGRPLLVACGAGLGELAAQGLARAVEADAAPAVIAAAMLRELGDPLVRPPLALPTWDECAASLLALYRLVRGRRPS